MTTKMAGCLFLAMVVVLGVCGFTSNAANAAKTSELSKALGQARLFAGLTGRERAALRPAATLRYCEEGERIIEQGRPLEKMFIVLEGQAEVRVDGALVVTLPEQSLVGEIEFLDALPASADVLVLKGSRLIELSDSALTDLMRKRPRVGYVLMNEIARIEGRRLRAMDTK
jgi:CRP/FNR family transcriptional regulator, cyclic AMP receptor protein